MYAHSNPKHPTDHSLWEPLYGQDDCHLSKVAEYCESFTLAAFQSISNDNKCWETLGRLTGLWHDLGKFSDDFQNYLKLSTGKDKDAHTSEVVGEWTTHRRAHNMR